MRIIESLHDLIKRIDAQIYKMDITINFLDELQPLGPEKITSHNAESLTQLIEHFKKSQDLITKDLLPQILALLKDDRKVIAPQHAQPHTQNWKDRLGKRNIFVKRQQNNLETIYEDISNSLKNADEIIANWHELREHCVELIKEKLK